MGSLLDTYIKQRDLRNFLRAQEINIAGQLSAFDEQVTRILDKGVCPRAELARSEYLHQYLVGILDAITSFYERETRKRLGLALYRETFVRYFRERFFLPRHEAERLFALASERLESGAVGMRDGYEDGLLALRGEQRPRRLLDVFAQRAANGNEIPDSAGFPVLAIATA